MDGDTVGKRGSEGSVDSDRPPKKTKLTNSQQGVLKDPCGKIQSFLGSNWDESNDEWYGRIQAQMTLTWILGAIYSITEAISEKGSKKFCFVDSSIFKNSKSEALRRGSELLIPSYVGKDKKRRLALLSATQDEDDGPPVITIWDVHKASTTDTSTAVKQFIRRCKLTNWCHAPFVEGRGMLSQVRRRRMPSAKLMDGAVHLVLRAWAHALGLTINEAFQTAEEKGWDGHDFFHQARGLIALALRGKLSSTALVSFLLCHDYVQKTSEAELRNAMDMFGISLKLDLLNNTNTLSKHREKLWERELDDALEGDFERSYRPKGDKTAPTGPWGLEETCAFDHSLLLRGITSVTEAINANTGNRHFSMVDLEGFRLAMESEDNDKLKDFPVAGRQLHLILPWVDRSIEREKRPKSARYRSKCKDHYFLISLSLDERSRPKLEIVDSWGGALAPEDHIYVQGKIKTTLEKFHWPNWDDEKVNGKLAYTGGVFHQSPHTSLPGHSHNCPSILVLIGWMIALGIRPVEDKRNKTIDPTTGALASGLVQQAATSGTTAANILRVLSQSNLTSGSKQPAITVGRKFENTMQIQSDERYEALFLDALEKDNTDYSIHLSLDRVPAINTSEQDALKGGGDVNIHAAAINSLTPQNLYNLYRRETVRHKVEQKKKLSAELKRDLVSYGQHFSMDEMLPAIYSVTEAIRIANREQYPDGPKFTFMSPGSQGLAHKREAKEQIPPVCRQRATFFMPWIVSDLTEVAKSGLATREEYVAARTTGHINLFVFDMNPESGGARVRLYDSSAPSSARSRVTRTILPEAIDLANRVQWWPDNELEIGNVELPPEFGRCICGQQANHWACGLHTVLNAWALALGLLPSKNGAFGQNFYKEAVRLINMAVSGHMDSRTIHAFFLHYDFVTRVDGEDIPADRRFANTFRVQNVESLEERYHELQLEFDDVG